MIENKHNVKPMKTINIFCNIRKKTVIDSNGLFFKYVMKTHHENKVNMNIQNRLGRFNKNKHQKALFK